MEKIKEIYKKIGLHGAPEGSTLNLIHRLIYKLYYLGRKNTEASIFLPFLERKKNVLNVLILCGIGDALWSFVFIPALLKRYNAKKVNLVVHWNGDHRSGRSDDLLKRFNFVDQVERFSWPIHMNPPVDSGGNLCYTYNAFEAHGKEKLTFDFSLIVNNYLEKGWQYQDIFQHLNLDYSLADFKVFESYQELPSDQIGVNQISKITNNDPYIVIYFGALVDNTIQGLNYGGLWTPKDWVELLLLLRKRFNSKFVIVGASYDISYLSKVIELYDGNFYDDFINTIGQYSMPETIRIMKNSKFVIGFASGVTISSTFMGIKTAIFWRPKNISMSPNLDKFGFSRDFSANWVPKDYLDNKFYIPLWYSEDTPNSVLEKIIQSNW